MLGYWLMSIPSPETGYVANLWSMPSSSLGQMAQGMGGFAQRDGTDIDWVGKVLWLREEGKTRSGIIS